MENRLCYIIVFVCVCVLVSELEGYKGVLEWSSGPLTRRKRQSVEDIQGDPTVRHNIDPLQAMLQSPSNQASPNHARKPNVGVLGPAALVNTKFANIPIRVVKGVKGTQLQNPVQTLTPTVKPVSSAPTMKQEMRSPNNSSGKDCQTFPNQPHCQFFASLNSVSWANRTRINSVEIPLNTISNQQKKQFLTGFGSPDYSFQECVTPSKQQGRCRFIHYCALPEILSNWNSFLDHACPISDDFVGVCCPTFTAPPIPAVINPPVVFDCGVHIKPDFRIVGGTVAKKEDWPWMVALLRNNTDQYCGATLISDRHIITAAHCVDGYNAENLTVRLGDYDFTIPEPGEKDFQVEKIIMHEGYDRKTFRNDIAILKLKGTTKFTKTIHPICLPPEKIELEGIGCYVAGWGTVGFNGIPSDILLQVVLPVWNNDECKKSYTQPINTEVQLCAGVKDGTKDSCRGDSGGPLMHFIDNERWAVMGIVSWGQGCAVHGKPTVYTRVSAYLPWIQNVFANS